MAKPCTYHTITHTYSDQRESLVFVNWTKQVWLQTRHKWWQWWGTPDIIWNSVPDRRRGKWKWAITKCWPAVCRSIEKRHGVWAGVSVAGVIAFSTACQWHMMVQYCCDSGSTNYFVGASYFERNPMKWL